MLKTAITAARIKQMIPQISRDLFILPPCCARRFQKRVARYVLPDKQKPPGDCQHIAPAGDRSSPRWGDLRVIGELTPRPSPELRCLISGEGPGVRSRSTSARAPYPAPPRDCGHLTWRRYFLSGS